MTRVEVFAPAKINLCLHVTGQRPDGLHLIDSLVAFARVGDRLTLRPADRFSLTLAGPEAQSLDPVAPNIVEAMAHHIGVAQSVAVTLLKALPVASGIGGGSADAAAFYRGCAALMDRPDLMSPDAVTATRGVGADLPMCVLSQTARVTGIGDSITPCDLPVLSTVLVNPRIPTPTGAVFNALTQKRNAPLPGLPPPDLAPAALIEWLAVHRNDLQGPAAEAVPEIKRVLACLDGSTGCGLARMSGSGATCFGLFAIAADASDAARAIGDAHPEWWVRDTRLDGHTRAAPQVMRSTT